MEPTITATSLDDLADVQVDVEIRRPDGRVVKVPMRALPESELFDIRLKITWPHPPAGGMTKAGPVLNYEDEGYLKALREANRRHSYLAMLHSLRLDIPGATEDDKLDTLQKRLGNYAYMQLITASNKLNLVTEGDLAAMANSFRAAGDADTAGGDAAADDTSAVVLSAQA